MWRRHPFQARTRLTENFGGAAESGERLLQWQARAEEAEQEVVELAAQLEATEAVVRAGALEVERAQAQQARSVADTTFTLCCGPFLLHFPCIDEGGLD